MTTPHDSSVKRRWMIRRRFAVPLVALVLLLGLYLVRVPILVGAARLVEVDDALRPADFIFLLNGDARTTLRARHAAALYRKGLAPRVVIARAEDPAGANLGVYPNDTDVNLAVLRRMGVPDGAVLVLAGERGVASTRDEAVVLREYLRREPAARVIVVTSDYHTARARWLVRRELDGTYTEVLMSGARHPEVDATNWWRSEEGLLRYFEEYLKFVHNWVYG